MKLTIFLFDAGRIIADNAVYRLSIYSFILEIFAPKVKSCPKSCQILMFLALKIFCGRTPNFWTCNTIQDALPTMVQNFTVIGQQTLAKYLFTTVIRRTDERMNTPKT